MTQSALDEADLDDAQEVGRAWFPEGIIETFTGEFVVGSRCPSKHPVLWAKSVRDALEARHIPEQYWVRESKSCLCAAVIDAFRTAHSTNPSISMATRILPQIATDLDPFTATKWNDFCDWLIRTYTTASHQTQLENCIQDLQCESCGGISMFIDKFNEACIYADYVAGILSGRSPTGEIHWVMLKIDTSERRDHFRRALPRQLIDVLSCFEADMRTNDPSWCWSLAVMQEHALVAATVLQEDGARRGHQPIVDDHARAPRHQRHARVDFIAGGRDDMATELGRVMREIRHLLRP